MWTALAAITTLAFALVTPIAGLAQEVFEGQKSVPEQVVDSFNAVFGAHSGARAVHAKGVGIGGQVYAECLSDICEQGRTPSKEKDPGARDHSVLRLDRDPRHSRHRSRREPTRHGGEISSP